MLGKYEIEVYNNKVHYFLTIKRNITILQGDSATGKTELIRLIQEHEANGVSSGITLLCDVRCTVLTSIDWELRLRALSGCIVFIDENAAFMKSQRFTELVKGSDNYFVIASRDALSQLPYSIEEIYGLRNAAESKKYKAYHRVYNEQYKLYNLTVDQDFRPEMVITEDSNSGFEFFSTVYPEICFSANGKNNVYDLIRKEKDKHVLAIVDGAAFGSEIGKVLRTIESGRLECLLYAPESFEHLLLSAHLFDVPKGIILETYLYADSVRFTSWEEFFTYYLSEKTRNTVFQYGKGHLAAAYLTKGSLTKITAVLPIQICLN